MPSPRIPIDEAERARRRRERAKEGPHRQWSAYRERRDCLRSDAHTEAASVVGELSDRDLLLLGAAIYWCEGGKSKPWRLDERVIFVNSDPLLVGLFLRFLEAQGRDRDSVSYRVSIHESADHEAAVAWWVERLALPRERFQRTTLKRHVPKTKRRNTSTDYHGCLIIYVPKGRELYWQIEGVIRGCGEAGTGSARQEPSR